MRVNRRPVRSVLRFSILLLICAAAPAWSADQKARLRVDD